MNFQNDRYTLRFAQEADDAGIRAVFAAGSFGGGLSIRFLRDPSPLASFGRDGDARIMVLLDNEAGKLFGVGGAVIRREFVGGQPRRTGYLTGLKILPEYQKRFRYIPQAYQYLYEHTREAVDVYYTTILTGNAAVQKMLEKPRKNMPRYIPLAEYTTYCFAAGGRLREEVTRGDLRGVDALFASHFSGCDFAPVSRALPGLSDGDFFTLRDGGGALLACCAVYDQRAWKQYELRGYGGLYRAASRLPTRLFGYPRLPKPGSRINYGSVLFLYVKDDDPALGFRFLRGVAALCGGYEMLFLGLSEGHPLSAVFRRLRSVRYGSRLYQVCWGEPAALSGRMGLEVSLL